MASRVCACVMLLLVIGVLLGGVSGQPVPESEGVPEEALSNTLLAKELDLISESAVSGRQGIVERPTRASPLAHIIADIIDIKYQLGRAFLSRFFSLAPHASSH